MQKRTEERMKVVPIYAEIKPTTKGIMVDIKQKTRKPYGHQIDEMAEIYHKLNK